MGVAIIGFTSDFDVPADMRDTPPDIGADEIVAVIAPGTLQFSSTSYTGTEGATATITVSRSAGSSGSVSVDYATSNGTATAGTCGTAGSDYQPASGTLTFAEGVVSQTFTVSLCADQVIDPAETVALTLTNPTGGATIGANNPATLTITDNPPGTLQFSAASYSGNEGTTAAITVSRVGGTSGAVSVDYQPPTARRRPAPAAVQAPTIKRLPARSAGWPANPPRRLSPCSSAAIQTSPKGLKQCR